MHCFPWLAKNDKNTLNSAKVETDPATQTWARWAQEQDFAARLCKVTLIHGWINSIGVIQNMQLSLEAHLSTTLQRHGILGLIWNTTCNQHLLGWVSTSSSVQAGGLACFKSPVTSSGSQSEENLESRLTSYSSPTQLAHAKVKLHLQLPWKTDLEQRLLNGDRAWEEQLVSSSLVATVVGGTSLATLKHQLQLINTSLQHFNTTLVPN